MTTPVTDPSKYGVVVLRGSSNGGSASVGANSGAIERFVEKPKEWVGDMINAGIYVFDVSVLERIPVSFKCFFFSKEKI